FGRLRRPNIIRPCWSSRANTRIGSRASSRNIWRPNRSRFPACAWPWECKTRRRRQLAAAALRNRAMASPLIVRAILRLFSELALRQGRRWKRAFEAATHQPRQVQQALLDEIIGLQKDTRFGREHHSGSIRNLADFRREIPILRYEDHEPYLAEVRRGKFDALLNTKTVHMFAMTSGTTATRKTIPVTPRYLADYR